MNNNRTRTGSMTHASLFSGIGGFDVAAQSAGFKNMFACEIDKFCQTILRYYFPNIKIYEDIRTTNFTQWKGKIDILTGGFPCQPFSIAGKRAGRDDDRYLWQEMLRAIRQISPSYIVAENVPGLLSIENGLVFESCCRDMEIAGYEVQPFIIPACAVGAPHKRDRLWIIAYKNTDKNGWCNIEREKTPQIGQFRNISTRNNEWICTNNEETWTVTYGTDTRTDNVQESTRPINEHNTCELGSEFVRYVETRTATYSEMPRREARFTGQRKEEFGRNDFRVELQANWQNFPAQSPVCSRNDGISYELDGIAFPKWRTESIKTYGNAIVPQIALKIFEAIKNMENENNKSIST